MKELKEVIHTALRDDSLATLGLRALLGASATPYGVYFSHFPEQPEFKLQSYLTWYFVQQTNTGNPKNDDQRREQLFSVCAWSVNSDTIETVLARARFRLTGLKGVTLPTTGIELHQILYEGAAPDQFDEKYKVYYRHESYRAYFRELISTAR